MSIELFRRVKVLEAEVSALKAQLRAKTADDVNATLVVVAKAAEAVAERMTKLEEQYRALNARVGKALKKQE